MSDEIRHGHAETEFEREDLRARPILMFLFWLAVAIAVLAAGLRGAYVLMDRFERDRQPEVNPLKPAPKADTREASEPDTRVFPEPRLEVTEGGQLDKDLAKEEDRLNSYGWVDEKAGTVHIPIERAMHLVAERGLPVRPQEQKK